LRTSTSGTPVSTQEDLQKMIAGILAEAMREISGTIFNTLKGYIMRDTYSDGAWYGSIEMGMEMKENKTYLASKQQINLLTGGSTSKPSWEFLNKAFNIKNTERTASRVTEELFYDYGRMTFRPDLYQHGSVELGDMREHMADIMNVSDVDDPNDHGGKHREPFWDNFINDIFANGGNAIKQIFDKVFAEYGIVM